MAFEFIGHADAVAKQQQLWGVLLLVGSALLAGYAISRGKPPVYWLGAAALCAVGIFFLYQWSQLKSNMGEWIIRSDATGISWQSPDESIDPSFALDLVDINYIDRSAAHSPSDHRRVYHLVLKNGEPIKLNPVSGINIEDFVTAVSQNGIEIRETNDYYLPVEQRNK